ncbi:hypothetical protein ACLOJK_039802, partial [Asimina triloba]
IHDIHTVQVFLANPSFLCQYRWPESNVLLVSRGRGTRREKDADGRFKPSNRMSEKRKARSGCVRGWASCLIQPIWSAFSAHLVFTAWPSLKHPDKHVARLRQKNDFSPWLAEQQLTGAVYRWSAHP